MEKGNSTTYEWRTGEKPTSVENGKQLERDPEGSGTNDDAIDFGDSGSSSIDFGDYVTVDGNGNVDSIDFGDQGADTIDFGAEDEHLDWEITSSNGGGSGGSGVESIAGDGVARGTDAMTVLENPATRNAFLDELLELETFLEQRLDEMKGEADLVSFNQLQQAPTLLQLQTNQSVGAMLAAVRVAVSSLTVHRTKHLLLIKEAPRYVDRLAETLQQKLKMADKLLDSESTIEARRQKSLEEQMAVEPRLELIITRTKELQKQIEREISKKYNDRTVNLIGGVSMI